MENNWVDGIHCPQQCAGPQYVHLPALRMRDTILHVCMDSEDLFGVYAGITVQEIRDGAPASVEVDLSGNTRVNVPAEVVSAGGCRHVLVLSESVKTFEVLGSLSEKIADRKRTAGENRLIEHYAG